MRIEYKKRICKMVGKIQSEERLKKIYPVVHRLFIHDQIENHSGQCITDKELFRQRIDDILDKLDAEKLKRIYLFLLGITGKAV